VTIGESESEQQKPAATTRKGSASARIADWFWRGSALAKARRALPELGERAAVFAQRARASAELAQNMLASDEPGELSSEGSACETYRQASYWALCALHAQAEPGALPEADRIWDSLDDALLAAAAVGEERRERLRSALRSGSFVYFAELPPAEQQASLIELRKLAQALLAKLVERSTALDAIYLQRAWRLALLGFVLLCVALSPAVVKKALEERTELTAGRSWRASSKFEASCASPAQKCPDHPNYFFHTNEEASPWLEFDLGNEQKISKVRVDNRLDCCVERADPMVIEVSSDQKHWRRVARHEGVFNTWEAKFEPAHARYFRVRLLKPNFLHLSAVHAY